MTDKKYSLEEIEAAMIEFGGRSKFCGQVKELLTRPRPEFAEGQVYAHRAEGGCWSYSLFIDKPNFRECRPLTLTEHGPAVKALRESVAGWLQANTSGGWLDLKEALAAFDSEISDD